MSAGKVFHVKPKLHRPDQREVYIHLLEDEIARLKRWIDELVRMHYRLDEPEQ